MAGPNGVANDAPRKPEAFDPGQIFEIQHDPRLPTGTAAGNLTEPLERLRRCAPAGQPNATMRKLGTSAAEQACQDIVFADIPLLYWPSPERLSAATPPVVHQPLPVSSPADGSAEHRPNRIQRFLRPLNSAPCPPPIVEGARQRITLDPSRSRGHSSAQELVGNFKHLGGTFC